MADRKWTYKALATDRQGASGYYGYGDSEAEALAECEKACRQDGGARLWKQHGRRVVIDLTTGEEVYRIGKR